MTTALPRQATASDLKTPAYNRPSEIVSVQATASDTGQSTTGRPLTLSPTQVDVWDASRSQRIWIENEDVQEITARRSRGDTVLLGGGIGVVMGAVIGAGIGVARYSDPCADDPGICFNFFGPITPAVQDGLKGAAIGALVGGIIGALIPVTDRYLFGADANAAQRPVRRRTVESPSD